LKPGMTANVSIMIAHKDDALQIKNAALRYRPADATPMPGPAKPASPAGAKPAGGRERKSDRTVYILSGNRPKPVQIKTGISDGVVTEVLEGLKENDQVVVAELSAGRASASSTNPFAPARRFP